MKRIALRSAMLALMLVLFSSGSLITPHNCQVAELEEAEQAFKQALLAVRGAERAGAEREEIGELADGLNSALSLMDEARELDAAGSAVQASALARQALEITGPITSRAVAVRDEALRRASRLKVVLFGSVPVLSFAVTLSFHHIYKRWRRRETERLMRMRIKKKEKG